MPNRLAPLLVPIATLLFASCGSAPPEDVYDFDSFKTLEGDAGSQQANGGRKPLIPDDQPTRPGFTPRSEQAAVTGRLIVDCDRQLRAWSEAMAAPRSVENQDTVMLATRALGIFVVKNRALLEDQVISGAPRNRGIASAALGFCGDPAVLPLLMNNVGSSESEVVAKTLLGIGVLSVPNTNVGPIYSLLSSSGVSADVESNAAFALFQIATASEQDLDGTMTSALLLLLDSPQASVRAQATLSLGLVKANVAMPPITDLLAADPDPQVRTAAAFALGRIGSTSSTLPLVAALDDPAPLAAGSARAALARIHGRDLGPDAESWRAAIKQ
ncbi:MAG: HEAT repeat domain-containing protein [Planctomycetes bacterium]|nr:HEAT repeat domain-containing protein [Planctomycetota bacterium]MCP4770101.1 HEAT repeat domain-containing protein [Planctomycetota bacterium]MCP4860751.1 HEAT repeat domain-containing protein [Planctomycetota bacterium]